MDERLLILIVSYATARTDNTRRLAMAAIAQYIQRRDVGILPVDMITAPWHCNYMTKMREAAHARMKTEHLRKLAELKARLVEKHWPARCDACGKRYPVSEWGRHYPCEANKA